MYRVGNPISGTRSRGNVRIVPIALALLVIGVALLVLRLIQQSNFRIMSVHISIEPTAPSAPVVPAPAPPPVVPAPRSDTRTAPGPAPEGMVWIPGGTYQMGSITGRPDERPPHTVTVDGFWMDTFEVTNEQFEKFTAATGYVTVAEKKPDAKDFPGAPPEVLVPGALVFTPTKGPVPLNNVAQWWRYQAGANWRHPEGPGSDIRGRERHPVVQVAWDDAVAYSKWAGKRLPTEAEWEWAARSSAEKFPETNTELVVNGRWQSNIWQGDFPQLDAKEDGYGGTAPVGAFPANSYGLYDMSGNVWEWCSDWYRPDYYSLSPAVNPRGPDDSFDLQEPGTVKRVIRGGSFLCHDCYCSGFRPASRMKTTPDTGANHTGFRCVKGNL